MIYFTAQVVAPFISPALAWAGVAMISVPVAIHLLSRWRRRPVPWGAMRFLLEAYRKQKRRMRLEQWLLLLLRCLIVLLLGLALARPLLVGFLGSWLGGLDNRGRIVNFVIDDAMSLQASDGPDGTRFDQLIDRANRVVDQLAPGDRVTLWRAGRPAEPVIAEPTPDHASLRQALAEMKPGYSRPDIPGALSLIAESHQDGQDISTQSITFLFSDFTRSAQYLDEAPATAGESITRTNKLIVTRPMPAVDNVQVTSLQPRRRTVWVGTSDDGNLTVEARIARLSVDLPETTLGLALELIDARGRRLSASNRDVVLVNGQREVSIGMDLPIAGSSAWLESPGGTLLTIRAQLDAKTDAITADNQAQAVVEVRRRMRVAVIDEPGGLLSGQDEGLTPGQWVALALNPRVVGQSGAIEVVPLTPTELNDAERFNDLDAVLLMRPDRVLRPVWESLSSFAEKGGLVWVFTPADEGSAPWVSLLVEHFEPGWRIGLEPVILESGASPLQVTSGVTAPEPLERLAPDIQALTRPLRISRYLPLSADEADAWLTLSAATGSARNEKDTEVLLAHHRRGMGTLLLLSTAVDTRWTNLPTKPLFVPLIHEALHGVLGARDRPGVVLAVSGDRPVLGSAWVGVSTLKRLASGEDLIETAQEASDSVSSPGLMIGESGVALAGPVMLPGAYQADTDAGPRRLIVDPDPVAGDTRQVSEEALTRWLNSMGAWRWLDEDNPGASLGQSADAADIGWALLWSVLILILIESLVSRAFSHAAAGRGTSLSAQLLRKAMHLRNGPGRKRGGAA